MLNRVCIISYGKETIYIKLKPGLVARAYFTHTLPKNQVFT